uniref:enolase C-terminal domain-like protein n=1 Tax=Candidatus Puniceispirillum sp. TaxID=2026719 RepID=UPI003F69E8FA
MNIQKLETFTSRHVSFVKVTTDDGKSGIGQMSTYHADITAQIFHRQVAPWVLGQSIAGAHHDDDTGDAQAIFADLAALVTEREHKFPGSYIYRALAGLDTALWDLVAQAAELPVTALIGGQSGTLRAYASSMKRDITPADEAARFCQLRDDKGFDAFKFRVGAECGRGIDEWPGRTEEIIPTVTAALGDGIVTMVDANSCFGVARAIEVGHMLEDHGITHYEEPC